MNGGSERQYVLLPREGLTAVGGPAFRMLLDMPHVRSIETPVDFDLLAAEGGAVQVIDTVQENGPKLVALDDDAATAINALGSPLRAIPVVEYGRPNPPLRPLASEVTGRAASTSNVTIICTDATTGGAVPDVRIVAFTNYAQRTGAEGRTDATGSAVLQLPGSVIDRCYAYPPPGYWGAFRKSLAATAPITLPLTPVDLAFVDCVRFYYGNSSFDASAQVKVGLLDTGVGPHVDLNIVSGRNTVTGEPMTDYLDGDMHGTHVAGLIGANGTTPSGLRGVAPGVPIAAYRVFRQGGVGATNYAILKAMIFAADEGCDIVNLSLGGGPYDPIVNEAIDDARNQGMMVVVAAGNDGRQPVSFPGAYKNATAVSAMGRQGTFPSGSLEEGDVQRPPNSTADPVEFVGSFSNIGPEIAIVGLRRGGAVYPSRRPVRSDERNVDGRASGGGSRGLPPLSRLSHWQHAAHQGEVGRDRTSPSVELCPAPIWAELRGIRAAGSRKGVAMTRYVLLFRHSEPRQEDLEHIARAPGVTVVDSTASRALLVEGPTDSLAALRAQLSDWIVAEEVVLPPPRSSEEHAFGEHVDSD